MKTICFGFSMISSYFCREMKENLEQQEKALWQVVKGYFNALPAKEDEAETVRQISTGFTFHGANLLGACLCHFYLIVRAEPPFHGSYYRCHAHIATHGTDYWCGAGRRYQ